MYIQAHHKSDASVLQGSHMVHHIEMVAGREVRSGLFARLMHHKREVWVTGRLSMMHQI